jgi:tRNA (cytidine/uridine-2'-O-)-methyltransferase
MNSSNEPATQPAQRVTSLQESSDAPLHIVLVEPKIPPNTGNVARLCAATGAALHLVEPLGFEISDRTLKRAGLDYWDALGVVIHPSLDAFLATDLAVRAWFLSTRASHTYNDVRFTKGDVLVFGSETAGLPASLLARHPDRALRIPMREHAVRSLNLSTSVGIVAYAALAHIGFPNLR